MRRWRWVRVLALAAVLGMTAAVARAEPRFCNDFPRTVFVAVAYQQDNGVWFARGWLSVTNNECSEFFNAPLKVGSLFYRIETDDYTENGKSVRDTWGDKDPDKFAVSDPGFAWDNAKSLTGKPAGARLAGFIDPHATDTSGDINMTITVGADGNLSMTLQAHGSP